MNSSMKRENWIGNDGNKISVNDTNVIELSKYVSGILNCSSNCHLSYDNIKVLDTSFMNLFHLGHTCLEYLIQFNMRLESEKDTLIQCRKESEKLRKECLSRNMEIKKLKKQLLVYHQLMYNNCQNVVAEKCWICNKVFVNSNFLQSHCIRRHPEKCLIDKPPSDQIIAEKLLKNDSVAVNKKQSNNYNTKMATCITLQNMNGMQSDYLKVQEKYWRGKLYETEKQYLKKIEDLQKSCIKIEENCDQQLETKEVAVQIDSVVILNSVSTQTDLDGYFQELFDDTKIPDNNFSINHENDFTTSGVDNSIERSSANIFNDFEKSLVPKNDLIVVKCISPTAEFVESNYFSDSDSTDVSLHSNELPFESLSNDKEDTNITEFSDDFFDDSDILKLKTSPASEIEDQKFTHNDEFSLSEKTLDVSDNSDNDKYRDYVISNLNERLMNIGIDPAENGISSILLKDKMECLKHQQNINARATKGYFYWKKICVQSLEDRVSNKLKSNLSINELDNKIDGNCHDQILPKSVFNEGGDIDVSEDILQPEPKVRCAFELQDQKNKITGVLKRSSSAGNISKRVTFADNLTTIFTENERPINTDINSFESKINLQKRSNNYDIDVEDIFSDIEEIESNMDINEV